MIKLNDILKESYSGFSIQRKDWSDTSDYDIVYSEFEKMRNNLKNYLEYDVVFRGFKQVKSNHDLLYISEEEKRPIRLGGHYYGTNLINLFWDMMKKRFPIESNLPIFGTFWYFKTEFFGKPMLLIPDGKWKMYQSDECDDVSSCLEKILRKKLGKEDIEDGNVIVHGPVLTDKDESNISEELYQPLVNSFHEIKNKNQHQHNDIVIGNKNYWLLSVSWLNNLPKWMREKIFTDTSEVKIGYGASKPTFVDKMKYKDVYNIIEYTMKYMKWSKENYKSWLDKKQK